MIFDRIYQLLGLNKNSGMARYLVRGSSASFIIIAFNVGLTFLNSIVIANLAGDYELGRYEYIMTWINLFCIFALFGYHTLAVREIPKLKANNDFEGIKHFWQQSFWWVLLAAFSTSILGWYTLNYFNLVDASDYNLLKIGLLMMPIWVITLLISGVLRGSKHIINSQLPVQVVRPLIFVIAVTCLFFGFQKFTATSILIAQLFALTLALVVSIYYLKTNERHLLSKPIQNEYESNWSKAALLLFFQGLVAVLNTKFDILLLNNYCTKEELAYYAIAVKVASLMGIVLMTVNLVIGPEISRLYNQKNIVKLEMLLSRSIKLIFILTLPIALFLIMFGPFVLSLFGKEFGVGYPVLIIFIFVALVNVAAGSVGNILNMTGYEKHVFYGILISLVFNIVLNIILIPLYGIIGAAISTGSAIIIWNLILWWFVKKKIGINPSIFNFKIFH